MNKHIFHRRSEKLDDTEDFGMLVKGTLADTPEGENSVIKRNDIEEAIGAARQCLRNTSGMDISLQILIYI